MVAAGAAAGVAIERLTVGRGMRKKARLALDSAGPYGSLRGMPGKAFADDGTELYYEVDDVDPEAAPPWRRAAAGSSAARPPLPSPSSSATATASARTPGTSSGPPCAASCGPCTGTSAATAGPARGAAQVQDGVPVTIDQLGRDLKAVIDAAAPEGPLVLVGHSMGGMTVMALADQYPELIRERVVGGRPRRYVVGAARRGQLRAARRGRQRRAAGAARAC